MHDIDFVSSPCPTSAGTYKIEQKNLRILLAVWGQPPKRKYLDPFLTSTKVHVVDQILSEGATEELLTFR